MCAYGLLLVLFTTKFNNKSTNEQSLGTISSSDLRVLCWRFFAKCLMSVATASAAVTAALCVFSLSCYFCSHFSSRNSTLSCLSIDVSRNVKCCGKNRDEQHGKFSQNRFKMTATNSLRLLYSPRVRYLLFVIFLKSVSITRYTAGYFGPVIYASLVK